MFRSTNRRRRSAVSPSPACIQTLETRQLLSAAPLNADQPIVGLPAGTLSQIQPAVMPTATGIVSVAVSRSGEVSIVGDSAANFVAIELSHDGLQISGWGTGTLIRMAGQKLNDTVTVPLRTNLNSTVVRSLSISLGAGDDTLRLQFSNNVTISRDLSISMGSGHDFVDISLAQADVVINRDLLLDLAGGHDRGVINLYADSTLVSSRDVSIRAGAGDDTLLIMDHTSISGDKLSSPELFQQQPDTTASAQSQPFRAQRDLTLDLGAGSDGLTVLASEAGRNFSILAGIGTDTITASNTRAGRQFRVTDADAVVLQNLTVVGPLTLTGTDQHDRAWLSRVSAVRIDADFADGNDQLVLQHNILARTTAIFEGGRGLNQTTASSSQKTANLLRFTTSLTEDSALELLAGILAASPQPAFTIMAL